MALFKPVQTEPASPPGNIDYLLNERVSGQWLGFLRALSGELLAQLSADEYRSLLRSMGQRLAQSTPMPALETIEDLENAINGQLAAMRWGYIRIDDSGTQLSLEHSFSPLAAALGVDPAIAGGFLEGLYEHWFQSAGADGSLTMRQIPEQTSAQFSRFEFGRHV